LVACPKPSAAQLNPSTLGDIARVFAAKLTDFALHQPPKAGRHHPLMRTRAFAFLYVIVSDEVVLAESRQQFRGLAPAGVDGDDFAGAVENGNLRRQRIERGLKQLSRCAPGKLHGPSLGNVVIENAQATGRWVSVELARSAIGRANLPPGSVSCLQY